MASVDAGAQGPAGPQGPQGPAQPTGGPFEGLTPIVAKQVAALVAASHGKVRVLSGHRTLQEQQAMYERASQLYGANNAAAWVADPANSNHVKGSAVDFAGDLTTLHQLAPQFGLVAPMSWEPWHLEMASTPQHASPAAYTTPPAGVANPTQQDFSNSAPHVAASLAEALLPTTTNRLGTAGPLLYDQGAQAVKAVEDPNLAAQGAQPAAAPTGPSGSGTSSGGTTSLGGANVPGGKGNVSPNQLYGALTAAGFDPVHAAAFVSIAQRESGFNTAAHNGNASTGDNSYGLFQINLLNGGWGPFLQAHGIADPQAALQTLQGSVAALKAIYDSSGMNPWGPYKHVSPLYNTNPQTGVDASGGAVTIADLQGLG